MVRKALTGLLNISTQMHFPDNCMYFDFHYFKVTKQK